MRTAIFTLVLIVALTCGVKSQTEAPVDIVDYFLLLPANTWDQYTETNGLAENRKKLLIAGDKREVIIDRSNAYLEIYDYTWDLGNRIIVTYFKKTDGEKIIGVSEGLEGGDCDNYYTSFYRYRKGDWTDITDQVLPEIRFNDFVAGWPLPELIADLNFDEIVEWEYVLPQHGTSIKLIPVCPGAWICFDQYISADSQEEFGEKVDAVCKAVDELKHSYAELKWDRNQGKFLTGWPDE